MVNLFTFVREIIAPTTDGNTFVIKLPIIDIAKTLAGAIPNIDSIITSALSLKPNPPIETGILAIIADIA